MFDSLLADDKAKIGSFNVLWGGTEPKIRKMEGRVEEFL